MNIDEALDRAADVIDERGWCQNRYENEDGSVCALGAINVAIGRETCDDTEDEVQAWLTEYLETFVPFWNDKHGRTHDEVTDALRRAAKQWREENQ